MNPLRRLTVVGVSVAVMAGPGPAAAFQTELAGGGTPGTLTVGDIRHVANIPYPISGSVGGGSDVEFASFEVTKLSEGAIGEPVCATDEAGECLLDENGEVVFETEERDFAFVGRLRASSWVIDVTDPEAPMKVGEIPCQLYQNDIQIQGTVAVMAQDDGSVGACDMADGSRRTGVGFFTADISDPRNPAVVGRAQEPRGAHTLTFHPTEPLVYVSNSDQIGDGRIHIFDVGDPEAPARVTDFVFAPVMSPHDITFNAEGTRAYAAARTFTRIIDTEDPRNPSLISTMPHHGYLSHQADPTPDGKYLLVSEELLGGGFTTPSPGGPMYVWDIRDEERPVEVGAFGNDELGVNGVSTSHVFRINPDGYSMGIAWYADGAGVIDYSDIRGLNAAGSGRETGVGPRVVAWAKLANADAWAAKMWQERHPGYLFVNDIARGFDVFHIPELDDGFLGFGTLRLGHRLNASQDSGVTRAEWEADCDYTPRTNGLDGWVQAIPEELADGQHGLTATGETPGSYDLDLYFYDEDCELIGVDEDHGTDETGDIPEGTAYVMVASFSEGGQVKIRLSAQ